MQQRGMAELIRSKLNLAMFKRQLGVAAVLLVGGSLLADAAVQPVQSVNIGKNRQFMVNGEAFFPIMGWLQDSANLPKLKQANFNTIAGYFWRKADQLGSGDTANAAEYAQLAEAAGLYFIAPFMPEHRDAMTTLRQSGNLLAWIQEDEPDMPHEQNDADVVADTELKINSSAPLSRLVDGNLSNWAILDPLQDAQVTIRNGTPVTATRLAVALTVSDNLAIAKQLTFLADGKPILHADLARQKGLQYFELEEPATFRELSVKVLQVYPGKAAYGSLGEIEALDQAGNNLLLRPAQQLPKIPVESVQAAYQAIKAFDPDRPVLMTFTGHFIPAASKYSEPVRQQLYSDFARGADVLGFDYYVIYGRNRPEWLDRTAQGVTLLREIAGPDKAVYEWIETCKGSKWIAYAKQKDVEPHHIRAEVWMAIIRGATAIGYFTHVWHPEFKEFAPTGANLAEITRLNAQITRLAPVILAEPPALAASIALNSAEGASLPAEIMLRQHQDALYLFANNLDMQYRGGSATIQVAGLKAGQRVEVIDQDRSIEAQDGSFTDDFAPIAVHLYRISTQPATHNNKGR